MQGVIGRNDEKKDLKKKDGSILSTLLGTHSRRFKSKISMFKQANSYENLYLIDKGVKEHEKQISSMERRMEM